MKNGLKTILCSVFLATTAVAIPQTALADDCSTDCGDAASFRYPCPTWRDPGRMCTGRNPARYASCEAAKAASCRLWQAAVDYAAPRMRPHLEGRFNADTWRAAVEAGGAQPDVYLTQCAAAGTAVCGVLGAELGGPWGGVIAGTLGVFVSTQVCIQSKSW